MAKPHLSKYGGAWVYWNRRGGFPSVVLYTFGHERGSFGAAAAFAAWNHASRTRCVQFPITKALDEPGAVRG